MISSNAGNGVNITGADATGNTVLNNIIGLTAAGTAVLGNDQAGVADTAPGTIDRAGQRDLGQPDRRVDLGGDGAPTSR